MTETPRWQLIADTLSRDFAAERLPAGSRLPTEAAMAQRFGVNRHTIRRAIELLVRNGQLRVEQGRGAFIADDLLDYAITPRTRFAETIRRHNRVPDGRVVRLREIAASPAIAAALAIVEGAPTVLLVRIGLADGVPMSLTDHHFPSDRLPGIAAALRDHSSITEALSRTGIADYVRHSSRVSARLPTETEAQQLEMPATRPLLISENVNVDANGQPVEYGVTRYPSTRVQLVFEP